MQASYSTDNPNVLAMFKKLKVSNGVKMIIEDVQEILYYIALVGMALFFLWTPYAMLADNLSMDMNDYPVLSVFYGLAIFCWTIVFLLKRMWLPVIFIVVTAIFSGIEIMDLIDKQTTVLSANMIMLSAMLLFILLFVMFKASKGSKLVWVFTLLFMVLFGLYKAYYLDVDILYSDDLSWSLIRFALLFCSLLPLLLSSFVISAITGSVRADAFGFYVFVLILVFESMPISYNTNLFTSLAYLLIYAAVTACMIERNNNLEGFDAVAKAFGDKKYTVFQIIGKSLSSPMALRIITISLVSGLSFVLISNLIVNNLL